MASTLVLKILPRALKSGRQHKYIQCFGRNLEILLIQKNSFMTLVFWVKMSGYVERLPLLFTDFLLIYLDGWTSVESVEAK